MLGEGGCKSQKELTRAGFAWIEKCPRLAVREGEDDADQRAVD